jgi:hypothetical protein
MEAGMSRADDDLDFLDLDTPPPETPKRSAREWQALARRENYGLSRITSGSPTSPGPGRPKGGQKRTPEIMRGICEYYSRIPVAKDACAANGITPHTLKLWLTKSRLGQPGDGFDLVANPDDDPSEQFTIRFHEMYAQAQYDGTQELFRATWQRAIGYREPLTFQGRVIYKLDPKKVKAGMEGMDAYLLDEDGRPVPESVEKQDPDLMQFLLKGLMPELFNPAKKIEVDNKVSGVLVVAQKAASGAALADEEKLYSKAPLAVEFEDGDDDDIG